MQMIQRCKSCVLLCSCCAACMSMMLEVKVILTLVKYSCLMEEFRRFLRPAFQSLAVVVIQSFI